MRLWKAVILVNLALGIGLGGGYLWWGRDLARLNRELASARQSAALLQGSRTYSAKGIVRTVVPEANAVFITHEEIPGLMRPMTMAFRAEDPKLLKGLLPGDVIQFTLKDTGNQLLLVALRKETQQ